jgi:hypothetical protein
MNTNIAADILEESNDFEGATHLVDVEGLSSARVCRFLNRLVARMEPGEIYLEIGTWKGRTLLSAAFGNNGKLCVGCDKFRFWGRFTGPGFLAKRDLFRNIERYRDRTAEIRFHHMTSRRFLANPSLPGPVGVYFYDGDHSYEGTLHGVVTAAPYLSERSVLVVDDWNDPEIRRATHDGIKQAGLEVLWSRELAGNQTEQGFWNGLGVFYLQRAKRA